MATAIQNAHSTRLQTQAAAFNNLAKHYAVWQQTAPQRTAEDSLGYTFAEAIFHRQKCVCVFANYRTNPLSRAYRLSFCNCAASPQPATLPVSCVAGFALNSLNSCRDHMRTTKMQSAISRIFSDPSTIAFRTSDCRQAQVERCSNAFKNIWSCIWTTRHVDPRQGLLQVGGELFVCHLHLSSWAELIRSTVK